MLLSTHMCSCVPTKAHLCMHTFLGVNAFLRTNMLVKCVIHHKTYNKARKYKHEHTRKSREHKKGSNQSDRSKLKRRVGMERYLPVGRVGEN